jgi:hypothetical protein
MDVVVTTAPTGAEILAILSVAELKLNMRITHTVEDTIFSDCIMSAYDWLANPVYGWLNRAILTTSYRAYLPGFVRPQVFSNKETGGPDVMMVPTNCIRLPKPSLVSVEAVTYQKSGPQVLDPSQYVVSKSGMFGTVSKVSTISWPTGLDPIQEAVTIDYTAGFGNGALIKSNYSGIVQAMKLLAGDIYRNREDTYAETSLRILNRAVLNGVERFAGRYRIMNAHS